MEEPKNGETITSDQTEKVVSNEEKTTEEKKSWIQNELEEAESSTINEDRLPALKLEENKITEIQIDFSKPFETWKDEEKGTIKKIVPVTSGGEKRV